MSTTAKAVRYTAADRVFREVRVKTAMEQILPGEERESVREREMRGRGRCRGRVRGRSRGKGRDRGGLDI